MRVISDSPIQYLDRDVGTYLLETYLTKDKFSECTMEGTILPYIASLDNLYYKDGFTGNDALHIDRNDPDRCVSPELVRLRIKTHPQHLENMRDKMRIKNIVPVLTRGILTSKDYVHESDKLSRLQFIAKVLSKQVKEYVRVDEIEVPSVNNRQGQRRIYPGYDVKWRGMKIKFSKRAFTI